MKNNLLSNLNLLRFVSLIQITMGLSTMVWIASHFGYLHLLNFSITSIVIITVSGSLSIYYGILLSKSNLKGYYGSLLVQLIQLPVLIISPLFVHLGSGFFSSFNLKFNPQNNKLDFSSYFDWNLGIPGLTKPLSDGHSTIIALNIISILLIIALIKLLIQKRKTYE